MPTLEERIRGGLWGVLVGDALGVPFEFKHATAIPISIEMVMPGDFPKTFPKVAYGSWSDDGALTLAFADSLVKKGSLDLTDLGARFVHWYVDAHYTPGKYTYDIGNTTQEALLKIMRGTEARVAGLTAMTANGNGSLMRTLPIALFHRGTDDALYTDACLASSVTHAHPFSQAACGIYSVAARHMLNGATAARAFIEGLKLSHVPLDIPAEPRGSGYVLDTLAFAIKAARSGNGFRAGILEAIRLGGDTDTTAAVAGGLLGVQGGIEAIPREWSDRMVGREVATPIIEALVKSRVSA